MRGILKANFLLLIALTLSLSVVGPLGCRGYTSEQPPVHINPNMDIQEKGKAYKESDFFEDGQYMRMPIPGTVARGYLKENEFFYSGLVNALPAHSLPKELSVDEAFLKRGQQLFTRTCAACHGAVGDGNGLVGRRLMVKPTSLHSEYMYGLPPGHFFNVIQKGIRTMQSYEHMISARDTWASVSYVRVLQMSQDINGPWIKRSASWWKQ